MPNAIFHSISLPYIVNTYSRSSNLWPSV
jgi:hypothetical protein